MRCRIEGQNAGFVATAGQGSHRTGTFGHSWGFPAPASIRDCDGRLWFAIANRSHFGQPACPSFERHLREVSSFAPRKNVLSRSERRQKISPEHGNNLSDDARATI